MEKYRAEVLSLGEFAGEFIAEKIMVFFGHNAPDELKEHSIVHSHGELAAPVAAGDRVIIDTHPYTVLAIGPVANENLKNLGHFVLKFNGLTEPEMDGDICVDAVELPPIGPGTVVTIEG
ncbi:MAG: PTS glucitol/sorbitol transporter subunit IIA [Spirochaetota bacterium]